MSFYFLLIWFFHNFKKGKPWFALFNGAKIKKICLLFIKWINIQISIFMLHEIYRGWSIFFHFICLSAETRIIVILLLIDQLIININTLSLNNARLNVIKRLKHVHFFCPSFEISVNVFKRLFTKFIVADNQDRMRNQRSFIIIHKRVERFIKKVKINSLFYKSSFFQINAFFSFFSFPAFSFFQRRVIYIFERSKNVLIDTKNPLLRDLSTNFFNIDFFDRIFSNSFFNSFLRSAQPSIRLINYITRQLYIIQSLRYGFDSMNQICNQCEAASFKNETSK